MNPKLFFPIIIMISFIAFFCAKKEKDLTEIFSIKPDTVFTFEQYEIGKQPVGWTNEITGSETKVNWNVIDDKGNKVVTKSSGDNSGSNFNLLILDFAKYKNLKLSVKIKPISGNEDQGGGLVWRYQDKDNYYIARANPLEKNFTLYRVLNGKREQFENSDVTFQKGEWFTIYIEMKNNLIKCYYNGKEEMEYKDDDNTFMNEGKVGFWTKADAISYFDDLQIEMIK